MRPLPDLDADIFTATVNTRHYALEWRRMNRHTSCRDLTVRALMQAIYWREERESLLQKKKGWGN
jgi:hypothetical protein